MFVRLSHEGPVSTLTIARPDKLNALNREVLADLATALEQMEMHSECRCLIVTGEGKAFVAGADIAEMECYSVAEAKQFAKQGHAVLARIESLRVPAIAAVNGFALGGGCELALACDFIYAADNAKFGQPEVKLGVIPGFGGTQRLSRRVGIARARELVYTGATLLAEEALRIGLVNAVHPAAELMAAVRKTAESIASAGPYAVSAAKRAILGGEGRPLADAHAIEIDAFASCFNTDDQKEGMAAFGAKRPAEFTGR